MTTGSLIRTTLHDAIFCEDLVRFLGAKIFKQRPNRNFHLTFFLCGRVTKLLFEVNYDRSQYCWRRKKS